MGLKYISIRRDKRKTKNYRFYLQGSIKVLTFATAFEKEHYMGQVSYGQLPLNPPGWEHSKGKRL